MKNFTKTLLFAGWVFLFACKKDDTTNPIETIDNNPQEFYEILSNESYGFDPLQKFDLYLPKKRSTKITRVLLLLHGGGWKEGDKALLNDMVTTLRNKKYNWAIVNANYRLTFQSGIGFTQQMDDIALLINKLNVRRAEYAISDQIFIAGTSAGGHLALAYAYKFNNDRQIKAACGIVAPTDLTATFFQHTAISADIAKLVGKSLDQNLAAYQADSPYYEVQQNSPPTILFYGGKDDVVPYQQGDVLQKKLKELGIPFEYNFYPDQTHNWMVLTETVEKMMKFGEKHVAWIDF